MAVIVYQVSYLMSLVILYITVQLGNLYLELGDWDKVWYISTSIYFTVSFIGNQ